MGIVTLEAHFGDSKLAGTPYNGESWTFQINGLGSDEKRFFRSQMITIRWVELETILLSSAMNHPKFDNEIWNKELAPLYFSIYKQDKIDKCDEFGNERSEMFQDSLQLPMEFVTVVLNILENMTERGTGKVYKLQKMKKTTDRQHVWTFMAKDE